MKTPQAVETEYTDLGTWLSAVSDRLRAHGWSLIGVAREEFETGYPAYHSLHELSRSLERLAKLLEAAGDQLCPTCGMVEIQSDVKFGSEPVKGEPHETMSDPALPGKGPKRVKVERAKPHGRR